MDLVFECAFLTIAAMDGEDAEAGPCSISEGFKQLWQPRTKIAYVCEGEKDGPACCLLTFYFAICCEGCSAHTIRGDGEDGGVEGCVCGEDVAGFGDRSGAEGGLRFLRGRELILALILELDHVRMCCPCSCSPCGIDGNRASSAGHREGSC